MGDAESSYTTAFSPKVLADDLERLIAKLPAPDSPITQHGRRESRLPRPSVRQLRPEELTAMIAGYQAGATLAGLAARYGYGRAGISNALKEAGVCLRRTGLTEEQLDEAERLYREGRSLATVAMRVGVDAGTVRTRLMKRGVPLRRASGEGGCAGGASSTASASEN